MTDERAVMLVKKVTYFGEFSYLNGSCIKYYCYVFEFLESFVTKLNDRCFCWFPAAMLVQLSSATQASTHWLILKH